MSAFGKAFCVRAAIAPAPAVLDVWARLHPSLRAPYDRIEAAQAWLACPCRGHAKAARHLAFANGDDNPVREGGVVVEGQVIRQREAVFAHWVSDNATLAAASPSDIQAALYASTAASAAVIALELTGASLAVRVRTVARMIAKELDDGAAIGSDGRDGHLDGKRRLRVIRASAGADDEVEHDLLERIESAPSDDDARRTYADWLAAHGRATDATFVRLQLEIKSLKEADERFVELSTRLRELAAEADPVWRRALARPVIEKCETRFDFICPRSWDSLAATDDPETRFCTTCTRNVYYATSVERARVLAVQGACVAVDVVVPRWRGDLESARPQVAVAGAIAPPPPDGDRAR